MTKKLLSMPAVLLTLVCFIAIIISRTEKTKEIEMEMISTFLTKKFIQRGIVEPAKQDIYKTGLELIIADIINILLILTLGFITKSFIYACIYLIMFWTVRRFSGGFHAKTYAVCRIVFIGTYISMICISAVLHRWLLVSGVCNLIAFATMYLFAPIPHPNKELNSKEKKANKLFAMITTLFCILISIILVLLGCKEGLIISLTLLAITILMYVGMLTNAKGGKNNVKNNR